MRKQVWLCVAALMAAYALKPTMAFAGFMQVNLVSDNPPSNPSIAPVTDANMRNPWGMSFGPTTPFWISNQATGTSTLYTALPGPSTIPLIVSIPTAGGGPPSGPTGQVFNSTGEFMIPAAGGTKVPSFFLFDTLDGTIQGWNKGSSSGPGSAEIAVKVPGAVFTGLALGSVGSTNYLYAADAKGLIWVYDSNFSDVTGTTFAGKFVDPSPVPGFTPFTSRIWEATCL